MWSYIPLHPPSTLQHLSLVIGSHHLELFFRLSLGFNLTMWFSQPLTRFSVSLILKPLFIPRMGDNSCILIGQLHPFHLPLIGSSSWSPLVFPNRSHSVYLISLVTPNIVGHRFRHSSSRLVSHSTYLAILLTLPLIIASPIFGLEFSSQYLSTMQVHFLG